MTQPAIPTPDSTVAPFTKVAEQAAAPPAAPAAAPDGLAPTTSPPASANTPSSEVASVAAAPQTLNDKVLAAEAAAARLVAKRERHQARIEAARGQATLAQQQLAHERALRQRAEEQAKRIETDLPGLIRDKGLTHQALMQQALDDSTPEGRIAKLEKELANSREQINGFMQTEQQRRVQENVTRGRQTYAEQAMVTDGDMHLYPHLAAQMEVRPDAVIAEAEQIMQGAIARLGRAPTFRELHEYQEWLYATAASKTSATRASLQAAREQSEQAAAAAHTPPRLRGARTLSGKATAPAMMAKSFNQMTPQEQIDVMAAQLRASQTARK